jgi:hypothetical protein
MTKQTNGSKSNGPKDDPNKDVQPWMGWIAAMFVVVIVVVAVALGIDRTNNQSNNAAEIRMTPLVGGMEVPVATGTGASEVAASEVTPLPEAITETATISMVTLITATSTATDTFPATGEMTPTETITSTEPVTGGAEITETTEVTAEQPVEATAAPTASPTASSTLEPTVEPTATEEQVSEPTATPWPTATPRPTATGEAEFEVGETVVASGGRVELHADAAEDALVLDSFGSGVALEVLDPGGDFTSYPVEVDGQSWVRVRAADGLVGWVMTEQVEAQ